MTYQPTPQELAEYDQITAHMNTILTTLTTTYTTVANHYGHIPTLAGIIDTLNERITDKQAATQYLAIAIQRIAKLEQGIKNITDIVTGTDSSESNSE